MSNSARGSVVVVFEGKAQNLEDALHTLQADLKGFGAAATSAGEQAATTLAAGEHKAAHEAVGLGERAKVAAEMVGMLGAESSESVLKIQGMGHAFSEAQHAFGGFGAAMAATAGSFALFKGADFLRESVDAAMEGEQATGAYNAALSKTPGLLEAANKSLEEHREQFTKLGIDDSAVKAMMAKAAGRGLDPRVVSENAAAFADLGVAIGQDFGGAVDAVTHGQRRLTQVMARLNLSAIQQKRLMAELRGATPEERVRAVLAMVERSSFAGAAAAQAGTAEGHFKAFHMGVHNLQEEVGTALLPALTNLATAMTDLLTKADHLAQPFGGLANWCQEWRPAGSMQATAQGCVVCGHGFDDPHDPPAAALMPPREPRALAREVLALLGRHRVLKHLVDHPEQREEFEQWIHRFRAQAKLRGTPSAGNKTPESPAKAEDDGPWTGDGDEQ